MNYAQYVSETEIRLPQEADLNTDGTPIDTNLWLEYFPAVKPDDEPPFKTYSARYSLVSESYGAGVRRIIQVWRAVVWEPAGRVAKLNGTEVVFPKTNEYDSQGRLVCNYNKLPNSQKILDGWMLLEETEYPTDGKKYYMTGILIDDELLGHKIKVVWEERVEVEVAYNISKLKLKRALESLGQWESFTAVLNQNESLKEDFDIAVTLKSNDPLVLGIVSVFTQQFGLTEEQIKTILRSCKSDI